MINIHENLNGIENYFDDEFLNIIYTDIKKTKNIDLEFNRNISEENFTENNINIFKLENYLIGSIGYTSTFLKENSMPFKEVRLISNDYNGLNPTFEIIYLKLIHNEGRIIGLQIANRANINERLEKVKELIEKDNSLKLLAKEKIYENQDEFNPDILNIAALTALDQEVNSSEDIFPENLESLVKNNEYILDVREDYEYDNGHVKNSINIPLRELFYSQEAIPKDKEVYIYCRSGHRSADAVNFLKSLGFKNVHNIAGGFIDISFNEFRKNKGDLTNSIITKYNFE